MPMVSSLQQPDNSDKESLEALLERLPGLYRDEGGGALRGVLRAIAAGRRELGTMFESISRASIEAGVARVLVADAKSGSTLAGRSAGPTTDELADWLGRRVGRRPVLRSGLRLEAIDGGDGVTRLRISISRDHSSLLVVWEAPRGAVSTTPALEERCRGFLPPGCRLQFAAVRARLPLNPRVEGLLLEGELL